MVEPLRHRQTKGAETDMLGLTLSRATPRLYRLLPFPSAPGEGRNPPLNRHGKELVLAVG